MASDALSLKPAFDVDLAIQRGANRIAVNFVAPSGLTALIGRSGAGKTSILDMIAGLLKPDAGRIVVNGVVLFDRDAQIDLPPERRACGYVFQDLRLFPHLRVRDNLLYGWRLASPAHRFVTLEEVVDFLGIASLLDRWPRTLSGGEAQRVAIGRVLLSGPRFLVLDEPLSALDAPRRAGIMEVIERIRDELALPILYVSHGHSEVERLAGTVIAVD